MNTIQKTLTIRLIVIKPLKTKTMYIKVKKVLINLDNIEEVEIKGKKIYFSRYKDYRVFEFDTEEEAQKEFERIEKLLIKE